MHFRLLDLHYRRRVRLVEGTRFSVETPIVGSSGWAASCGFARQKSSSLHHIRGLRRIQHPWAYSNREPVRVLCHRCITDTDRHSLSYYPVGLEVTLAG